MVMNLFQKKFFFLLLILNMNELCAQFSLSISSSMKNFIQKEWSNIPALYRGVMPPQNFEVSPEDQKMLRYSVDATIRNQYFNSRYAQLSDQLSRCLVANNSSNNAIFIANWYHFAKWASISAGKVINNSKFQSLNVLDQKMYQALQSSGMVAKVSAIKENFSATNLLIALDMIPVGAHFIAEFCNSEALSNPQLLEKTVFYQSLSQEQKLGYFKSTAFYQNLNCSVSQDESHRLLCDAFAYLWLSLYENELKPKMELILYADILQVISEQIRVDDNLKMIFKTDPALPVVSPYILHKMMSLTQYSFGELSNPMILDLTKDLSLDSLSPWLIELKNQYLVKFFANLRLINKLNVKDSNFNFYPNTATHNWANFSQRIKYLAAMFRIYLTDVRLSAKYQ